MSKKVKNIAIVFFFVAILAIAILGIIFWYANKWNKERALNNPEEVTSKYFEFIASNDYEGLYNLLTNESKIEFSKEEIAEAYAKFNEQIQFEKIEFNTVEYDKKDSFNTTAKYTGKISTVYGDINIDNNVILKKQDDNRYYIDWNYDYIYNGYNKEDTIKIDIKEAKRGNIVDRNGILLAGSGYVSSVGLVPGWMNAETKSQDIQKVAEILETSVEAINKKLSASYVKSDTFVELDVISKQELTKISELSQIKGIKLKDIESRVYPLGSKAAHITGYVQKANKEDLEKNKKYSETTLIGRTGLEYAYDDRLRGQDGIEVSLNNSKGKSKKTLLKIEKKDGENIKLTIDSKLQTQVYDEYASDCSATLVMNYKNGEIMAMVSTPSYDPNKFVTGMSNSEWNSINNDPKTPLYNRLLKRYTPGSSFKPIIGAIALKTGVISENDKFEPSGTAWQKDSSWGAYNITTLKKYNADANLLNALINSDNIFFAKVALKIGADKLAEQLRVLGFGEGINFVLEAKNSQISNDNKFTSEIQLADSGYGQGQILINPIHYCSLYSAFANNGNMVMPQLEIGRDSETTYFKENAFSKEIANIIKNDLIQTIENPEGTAHSAKINGITLAGKTGTAETKSNKEENGKEIGWFNAFVADESTKNPYVIISMVENVENKGGSMYVIPKVTKVFKSVLK